MNAAPSPCEPSASTHESWSGWPGGDLERDPGGDRARFPVEQLDPRRRLLEDQDPAGAIGAHGLDLRIVARDQRTLDVGQVDGLPDIGARVVGRELDPGRDRGPIPERHHRHVAPGLAPEADTGDLLQRHVLGAQHRKSPLVASLRHQPSVSPSLSRIAYLAADRPRTIRRRRRTARQTSLDGLRVDLLVGPTDDLGRLDRPAVAHAGCPLASASARCPRWPRPGRSSGVASAESPTLPRRRADAHSRSTRPLAGASATGPVITRCSRRSMARACDDASRRSTDGPGPPRPRRRGDRAPRR